MGKIVKAVKPFIYKNNIETSSYVLLRLFSFLYLGIKCWNCFWQQILIILILGEILDYSIYKSYKKYKKKKD